MSDYETIEQLKQGNEQAFRELVEQYQQMVVRTCYGILRNREDAEDVAQDVFVEVYRSISGFRADAKLSTWLYRIAVNRSLNHIRDNKKRRWLGFGKNDECENTPLSILEADATDQPEYILENKQRAAILFGAINRLPDKQKVAFLLRKNDGLSYREIADVMELSQSSVESLLFRAKKNLQKKLFACYRKKSM